MINWFTYLFIFVAVKEERYGPSNKDRHIGWLADWLIHELIKKWIYWLMYWLINGLTDKGIDWLIDLFVVDVQEERHGPDHEDGRELDGGAVRDEEDNHNPGQQNPGHTDHTRYSGRIDWMIVRLVDWLMIITLDNHTLVIQTTR